MTAPAQDVTGVFSNDGGEQLFSNARAMRVQVLRDSKVMQHPLENGSSVIDHRVTLPIEAQLLLILPGYQYRDLYGVIKGLFLAGEQMTVLTKVDSFPNMFISKMPHEETPDMMDAVQMVLSLQEAQFFKTQFNAIAPRAAGKSTTTSKRGEQAPRSSVAYDIFKK